MKSGDVLNLLKISRPTLAKYLKEGRIKAKRQSNGQWDYNEADVYKVFNKSSACSTAIP